MFKGNRRSAGAVSGLIAVGLALAACGGSDDAGADGVTTLTLGASVEQTGPAAAIGTRWKEGIELAVEAANGADGFLVGENRYKWELDLRDNQSAPDQAIANYRAFVGDQVDFIVGPGLSTAFPPAYSSLANASPIVMTPSLAASEFVEDDSHLFITHLNDGGADGRVAKVVDALVERFTPNRVAILLPQDEPGERYTTLFAEAFESAGAEIAYSESFPSETRDFGSYISAMRRTTPDLVVSGYLDSWLQPLLNQAVDAGFTSPVFVGAPGSNVTSLEQTDGQIVDFAWSVTTRAVDNDQDSAVARFRQAYADKFGSNPDANGFWALSYYDPILMLTKAMQNSGTVEDLDAIADALTDVEQWQGSVMDGTFGGAQQLAYTPQIGISHNGEISYLDAD